MDSLESRLANAKLAAAIENACGVLPSDCIVRIELSNGSGTVTLDIDGVEQDFPSNLESMADAINDAIEHAQSTLG